ncbi:MAG: AbrB/MazE/SpoVT family DNA-binding domain-containing protein [Acidobacteriales bacterium]|nr:AbrB/MazE/SpoVT family DNA-binding domain-containing protein [Terriglobales bacterium]
MKRSAKLTSKGRITIPLEIRKALGVGPGDRLIFENVAGTIRVRALVRSSPFAQYRGIGNPKMPSGRTAIVAWLRRLRNQ